MDKFGRLVLLSILIALSVSMVACWFWTPKKTEIRCGEHLITKGERRLKHSLPGEFPFLVQITSRNGTTIEECTGILFKSNMVLSSSKCLDLMDNYKLAFGDDVWNSDELKVLKGGEEVSRHPFPGHNYYCSPGDGYAIFYLASRLSYSVPSAPKQGSKSINRVCMDTDDSDKNNNLVNKPVIATGWSRNSSKNERALAIELTVRECEGRTAVDDIICLVGRSNDNNLGYLLEGAALVRDNSHNEWDLIGLYTRIGSDLKFINLRNRLSCYPIKIDQIDYMQQQLAVTQSMNNHQIDHLINII